MRPAAKRRAILTPQGRMSADINVTPLVDVVLVLLIIFMVVTPLAQADLPVELPRTSQEGPATPGEAQVVVSLDAAGQLRIDDVPVADADYAARLRQVLTQQSPGSRRLFFQADDRVNYGVLVSALDTARSAGAESLEVVTDGVPTPAP
ncbi:MAG TPA: biopolymer transporter ExbD [Aggregicoccus sp.]|nr:biopolymer transporter ExbD [Aggregicoccus sp.]